MIPFLLLALGMGIVLGSVIWLKLHPFLALSAAAIVISFSTPQGSLSSYAENHITSELERGKMSTAAAEVFKEDFAKLSSMKRVVKEFGNGCAKVGLIIAFAALIGRFLLESGAAAKIVLVMLSLFGERRAGLAFLISGFLLAIPVFFDTVFYLLIPIAIAMAHRTKGNYLFYVLCIVAGGTMAHSLVPPTPGPLLVAEEIGVDIGAMMLGGLAVGLFTITFGYLYARWASGKFDLKPPPMVAGVSMDEDNLPSAMVSFLPVLLPVLLVAGGTLHAIFKPDNWEFLKVLGEKNLALGIAAVVAFIILAKRCSGDKERLRRVSSEALSSGAVIVLITAAGAAFGGVLKQTDIASAIGTLQGSATLALPVCFLITALVRTAQGSATVAMITAAPVAAAFAASPGLGFHPVYLALAVGCGSKPIPWMNDSGFWVVTRMSGLKESQTLRTVTPMMSLMGVTGLLVVIVASWVLPLS
ncbi:MAG: SLC13 family permease [Verrucomicrobiales bacterium]